MVKIFVSKKLVAINALCGVKKLALLLLLPIYLISCKAQPCVQLPKSFQSYSQAINLIKKGSFIVEESANTSGSSWISSANYYSCDGATGYFIIKTEKGGEYIHTGVSIELWKEFKNSSSKGAFYNTYLKKKFQLYLN